MHCFGGDVARCGFWRVDRDGQGARSRHSRLALREPRLPPRKIFRWLARRWTSSCRARRRVSAAPRKRPGPTGSGFMRWNRLKVGVVPEGSRGVRRLKKWLGDRAAQSQDVVAVAIGMGKWSSSTRTGVGWARDDGSRSDSASFCPCSWGARSWDRPWERARWPRAKRVHCCVTGSKRDCWRNVIAGGIGVLVLLTGTYIVLRDVRPDPTGFGRGGGRRVWSVWPWASLSGDITREFPGQH